MLNTKSSTICHKRESSDKMGDKVGEAYLLKDSVVVDKVGIIASEDAERMSFFDALGEIAKNWSTIK